jgi:hypothetical protein
VQRLLTMCAALGANGRFCGGHLDVTAGQPGEARVCTAGLHRFLSDGEGWMLDLSWEPIVTEVDLEAYQAVDGQPADYQAVAP